MRMEEAERKIATTHSPPRTRQAACRMAADQTIERLQNGPLTLELPSGIRSPESVAARNMAGPLQPVRKAFKRLAKLGFPVSRPTSGTTVGLISGNVVLRPLLDAICARGPDAAETMTKTHLPGIISLIEQVIDFQQDWLTDIAQ